MPAEMVRTMPAATIHRQTSHRMIHQTNLHRKMLQTTHRMTHQTNLRMILPKILWMKPMKLLTILMIRPTMFR